VGQGASLKRREFLDTSVKLGGAASATSFGLAGCESATPELKGGFIGPNIEQGHRLRQATGTPENKHHQAEGAARAQPIARQAKVVILGAGIAGLAAAWHLQKQGIQDFVVLELEKKAGGNSRAHQIQNLACPMGAHYLPVPLRTGQQASEGDGLEPVRELLSDLGLMALRSGRWQVSTEGERHLCHSPQERLFFRDAWHEGLLPLADVGEPSLNAYRRFSTLIQGFQKRGGFQVPVGLTANATANSYLSTAQLSERLSLDQLSFKAWLGQHRLDDPHLNWYLDYCCRDDYGAGIDTVSAWAGVHYFASRHGFQVSSEESKDEGSSSAGVFTWPEGNGWLSTQMAATLGDRFHGERLAIRVELKVKTDAKPSEKLGTQACLVRITAQHGDALEHWDCEHCILALPLFISQRLLKGGVTAGATLAALQTLSATIEHSSWMVANAYLDRELRDRGGAAPAWDNVLFGGQGLGYVNARHQTLTQNSGPTILTYYQALGVGREARKNLLEQPWQAWHSHMVQEFKPAHPDFKDRLKHLDIARFGHAMAVPKPGWHGEALRQARAHLLQSDSPLSFAHSDLAGYSVFEEAFTLGAAAGQRASKRAS
jgi:NAD(P)-binding Rossmann-like domain